MTQDALFDTEQLARDAVAATPWTGRCPLRYTTDYYTPTELDAAFARWRAQYGHFGSIPLSHMWFSSLSDKPLILDDHELHVYKADASCDLSVYGIPSPGRDAALHDHTTHPLPGQHMTQANCPTCRWHRIGDERDVIEAWHDHAFPGWRQLPVLPAKLGRSRGERKTDQKIRDWTLTNYPTQWHRHGSPIVTERGPHGTRPVAGRAPFGGYDMAHLSHHDQ